MDVEFVSLAAVANIDAPVELGSSLPGFLAEISGRGVFHGFEFGGELGLGNFPGNSQQDGTRIILHNVAGQNAQSGESAGKSWDDHGRDAQGLGESAGVQASGAAEGD